MLVLDIERTSDTIFFTDRKGYTILYFFFESDTLSLLIEKDIPFDFFGWIMLM
jgi:hypothetical protein